MKISWAIVISVIILVFSQTGCAPMITQKYAPATKNILTLRDISSNTKNKINIGKFEGDSKITSCRAFGYVSPPNNVTYATYIRNALIEELMLANVYSEKSNIEINGKLKEFEVDCAVGTGKWIIEMEFNINGKEPFTVKVSYDFEGAFIYEIVFNNAQQSLVPATQEFLNAVLNHDKIKSAILNGVKQ
jgi:hypothetical protein